MLCTAFFSVSYFVFRLLVLTATNMHMDFFWGVEPCNLIHILSDVSENLTVCIINVMTHPCIIPKNNHLQVVFSPKKKGELDTHFSFVYSRCSMKLMRN